MARVLSTVCVVPSDAGNRGGCNVLHRFRPRIVQRPPRVLSFRALSYDAKNHGDSKDGLSWEGALNVLIKMSENFDGKLTYFDKKFDEKFSSLERKMEEKLTTLEEKISALERKMEGKFTTLEEKMDNKFSALEERIGLKFHSVEHKIEEMKAENSEKFLEVSNAVVKTSVKSNLTYTIMAGLAATRFF